MYEQCSQALGQVAAFYREHGCPCAFPRCGQLVQFDLNHYTQGPVGCHATEIAIALVTAKDSPLAES